MSALESIIKWALNDLPDWQSDAVRRLLTQEELSDKDEEEIFKMLKSSCDLLDKKGLDIKPNLLNIGDISGVPQVETKITLKAIQNLYGINALPDGSFLPFGHKGLTVVYGENGTGKSGYARVLKKACRARDTKEKILPDVFCKDKHGPAKAEFKFSINDGEDDCVLWEDDKQEKTIMSNICIFDSKCARVIIDEKNEAVYLPYGAHVFGDLVNLLKKLRLRLEGEKSFPDKLEYPDIPKTTGAGKFIDKLSHKSEISEIEEWSLLSKEDEVELLKLKKKIAKIEAGFLYNLLRETWESLVEQDLLFETVLRHGSEVQTQRLKSVTITTEDYKKIHINMSKCSKWMFGHDKSKSIDVNRPSPNELKEDIENINTFSKEIRKRRETLRKEREKSLEPVTPEVG